MANARAFLVVSLGGLASALLLGTVASLPMPAGWAGLDWGGAHVAVALFGFLLPGLGFLHWQVAGRRMPRALGDPRALASLWVLGALLLVAASLLGGGRLSAWTAFLGTLVAFAAGLCQTILVMRASPRRGESVVDIARDPLTKGDDASLKHVKFAHMIFLPLSLLGIAATSVPGVVGASWVHPVQLASYHWLLAGYALLSTYGLSHIAVPRLCGVPAIAAGAIKGELHSSLLGLVLLAGGFLASSTGMQIAGGAFLFLGAFVFMGVLGANIMKNKSPTQRVTPEFAYIPWTFAGVFWLIAGVLLGLFLGPAAVAFKDAPQTVASLRFIHVHAVLFGGMAMLLLGFATRILPAAVGRRPAPFSRTKWPFYGLNLALCLLGYGHLTGGIQETAFLSGAALALLSLTAWFITLWPTLRAPGGQA